MILKLTILGTGNANVTECYNTCFIFEQTGGNADDRYFLVDAGGGNGILRQLKRANIRLNDIHTFFCTHKHLDHFTGMLWIIRMLLQEIDKGNYTGNAVIYGHNEVTELLRLFSFRMLPQKITRYIDDRMKFISVSDGEHREILGKDVTFFDIGSTKAKQFGFSMQLNENGERLTCCGDEPFRECEQKYAENSTWLLHEAFCLYSERDIFRPYEKHHSTVKDACELAERLHVKNLLLYHTEDKNILKRKALYTAESRKYFSGNIYVPDDMESFEV